MAPRRSKRQPAWELQAVQACGADEAEAAVRQARRLVAGWVLRWAGEAREAGEGRGGDGGL